MSPSASREWLPGRARGTTTASYTYNGDSLRASKKVGSTTTKFVYDTAEGLPLVLGDGASYYLYGPGGIPFEQITTAGVVTYLHADQLGSIRMITGSTGKSVGTATYTAYGTRTTTGTTSAFGFAGQYTDTESGLQWLRARYYDPTTAQFLTVDPLTAATGARYSYATGNPITGADPSGLFDWGTFSAGVVNTVWGTVKVAQGAAIVLLGATATVTGIGTLPGVLADAYGVYQIGSGFAKVAKGARQVSTSLESDDSLKTCDVAGNLVRFVWGTVPGGAFLDSHTDWLDKWGSLP